MARSAHLWLLSMALSGVAGFTDLLTFVKYGEFAALQTGNMILIGQLLTEAHKSEAHTWKDIGFHVATLVSNFGGVFLFCAIAHFSRWPVKTAALVIPALTVGGGLLEMALGGCRWSVLLVAASMGAMNFISSPNTVLSGKLFTMTALATGNLQKLAKMLFKCLSGHRFTHQEREQTCIAFATVVGTISGALIGGVTFYRRPFGGNFNDWWYLYIVAFAQFAVIGYHDCLLRPQAVPLDSLVGEAGASDAPVPGQGSG